MADEDREKGLLSRWARRKEAVREAEEKERQSPVPEPATPQADGEGEAEIAAALPDIESLDETSDFSVFMREGVPAELRRQALRKLWRINPIYNFRDGLAEYDLDYTMLGKPLAGGVKTIYQVGRGMLPPEPKDVETATSESPAEGGSIENSGREATSEDVTAAAESQDVPLLEEAPRAGDATTEFEIRGEDSGTTSSEARKAREGVPADAPRRRAAERRWGRFNES